MKSQIENELNKCLRKWGDIGDTVYVRPDDVCDIMGMNVVVDPTLPDGYMKLCGARTIYRYIG